MTHPALALDPEHTARFDLHATDSPMQELQRLRDALGGPRTTPRLWVKRDDLLGVAGGGNKARKLEFLVADALAAGATDLVTVGGIQSNHARQTAAAAAIAGLGSHLVLRGNARTDDDFRRNGNVLLDGLLGADITVIGADDDAEASVEAVVSSLLERGRIPYVIPLGGSTPRGSLGYVRAAREIIRQLPAVSRLVCGTGSGGTQAGLVVGTVGADRADVAVTGYCVYQPAAGTSEVVSGVASRLAAETGIAVSAEIDVRDHALGEGYGHLTEDTGAAIRMLARTEGLLLDPVYTGKAMAGLLADIRDGRFSPEEEIVFLHTGGSPALYAYRPMLT